MAKRYFPITKTNTGVILCGKVTTQRYHPRQLCRLCSLRFGRPGLRLATTTIAMSQMMSLMISAREPNELRRGRGIRNVAAPLPSRRQRRKRNTFQHILEGRNKLWSWVTYSNNHQVYEQQRGFPLRLLYLLLLPPTNNYYQYDLHHGSQLATNVASDNKSDNFFTRLLLTLLS